MIEPVRLATPEEVEEVKAHADLGPGTVVYAMGKLRGVVRQCFEIDPVFGMGESSNNQKHYFMSNLETFLRLSGVVAYYFNLSASPEAEKYRKVVEGFGAVATSREPEIRYKKNLI